MHRQWHHNQMTFAAVYAWSENFILPISHDEVVHGKRSLVVARCRATVGSSGPPCGPCWPSCGRFPGKQLLFMGCELADAQEWSEQRGLDWGLLGTTRRTPASPAWCATSTRAYRAHPALWTQDTTPAGFRLDRRRRRGQQRRSPSSGYGSDGSVLVCVANFAAIPHDDYRLGLPRAGPVGGGRQHRRDRPTAARAWATSAWCAADGYGWHGRPASATLTLPAARRALAAPDRPQPAAP